MSQSPAAPGSAQALVELRRARILAIVASRPEPAGTTRASSPEERVAFFLREAEELYWNELAWEQMTDEEIIAGGHLTELVFPGFLALIDGLLQEQPASTERSAPRSYSDVVEEILTFLGERSATLTAEVQAGADSQQLIWARAMTLRLIDLVLYRLYRLTPAEREIVEADD